MCVFFIFIVIDEPIIIIIIIVVIVVIVVLRVLRITVGAYLFKSARCKIRRSAVDGAERQQYRPL